MWTVVFEQPFEDWFYSLTENEKVDILAYIRVLEVHGANLGRPQVDTLKGSQLKNLKELRVQHAGNPYRILFVFDPLRQAVLLCGGNKTGDKRFYDRMILIAEASYKRYLEELKNDKTH
jgi:hypothetical protein